MVEEAWLDDGDTVVPERALNNLLKIADKAKKTEFVFLDTLADVINQACLQNDNETLDSMALSAYADGLRLLAEYGKVEIISEYGRRVIAKWKEVKLKNE